MPLALSTISLAGSWLVSLGKRPGERSVPIALPGTLDRAGLGEPVYCPPVAPTEINPKRDLLTWTRRHHHVGPACYEREIDVPASWEGHEVELFIEMCRWVSCVWIDGWPCGEQESLVTPHVFSLGVLAPGRHRLVVRADNTLVHDLGNEWADWSHSVSEMTQLNWHGLLGRIELRVLPLRRIAHVEIYPSAARRELRIVAELSGIERAGPLDYWVSAEGVPSLVGTHQAPAGADHLEFTIPLAKNAPLWDEFSPALHTLRLQLGDSVHELRFGLRDWGKQGTRLTLNGRPLYLRGNVDNCVFPIEGHPPADEDSWRRLLLLQREHGLNCIRFHSWTPPAAAFRVADELGFYLQAEAPVWIHDWGLQPRRDAWVAREARRIVRVFGNHPSFLMMSMGNEQTGDTDVPNRLVAELKSADPRRAYAFSTGWGPGVHDDFETCGGDVPWLYKKPLRGRLEPSTDWDYTDALADNPVPILTHELGQYASFPNPSEETKFTGVIRPRSLELIRASLAAKGLLDDAPVFARASSKLVSLLYKADIEGVRRTPGHGGYHLLDLQDCYGQGMPVVGVRDVFWNLKPGACTPKEFAAFSGPVALLARFSRRVHHVGETLDVAVDVSHYGREDLRDAVVEWTLREPAGRVLLAGALAPLELRAGEVHRAGEFTVPLAGLPAPARYVLALRFRDVADIPENTWNHWVYPRPADLPPEDSTEVVVADRWTPEIRAALVAGARVLFLARPETMKWLHGFPFGTLFWSPALFGSSAPNGHVAAVDHPSFAHFPCDEHQDWQWFDVLEGAHAADLDRWSPPGFRPVLQVVDNFCGNKKLGALFECRVGQGSLFVSTLNLLDNLERRPAARQLRSSIYRYVASRAFVPEASFTEAQIAWWMWPQDLWWRKPSRLDSARQP